MFVILLVFDLEMDEEDRLVVDNLSSFSFSDSTVTKAERCENDEDEEVDCCLFIDAMAPWAEVEDEEAGGEKADEGCGFCFTLLLLISVVGSLSDEKIDLSCCSCSCC